MIKRCAKLFLFSYIMVGTLLAVDWETRLQKNREIVKTCLAWAEESKSLEDHETAIHWFKVCMGYGETPEEVGRFDGKIAECYEQAGYWDLALRWYLEAFQKDPTCPEPLLRTAKHYRLCGQVDAAYIFAKQGAALGVDAYQSLFDEELSICAYYTPFRREGFAAANRLMLRKNATHSVKEMAARNILFYVESLPNAHYVPLAITLPPLREGMRETYYPMNSSLQKTADGYALICRTVNYKQHIGLGHESRDPQDSTLRTRNFLMHYDRAWHLLSQKEMIENNGRTIHRSVATGLEDCRLIELDHELWFTCCTFDAVPGMIYQALCRIGPNSGDTVPVDRFVLLDGQKNRLEKNWLPFTRGNDFFMIYSYDPLIIYKVNRQTGVCATHIHRSPSNDFSQFRGSAAPIEFDEGLLAMVHEVTWDGSQRCYTHRFVYFDKELNITKLSKPFIFFHRGVEYCSGMTIDHEGKNCILGVSQEDREAYLCTVSLDTIRQLLETL